MSTVEYSNSVLRQLIGWPVAYGDHPNAGAFTISPLVGERHPNVNALDQVVRFLDSHSMAVTSMVVVDNQIIATYQKNGGGFGPSR